MEEKNEVILHGKYDTTEEGIKSGLQDLNQDHTNGLLNAFKSMKVEEQVTIMEQRGVGYAIKRDEKGKVISIDEEVAYTLMGDIAANKIAGNTIDSYKKIVQEELETAEEKGLGALLEGIHDSSSEIKQLTYGDNANGTLDAYAGSGMDKIKAAIGLVERAAGNCIEIRDKFQNVKNLVNSIGTDHLEENEEGNYDIGEGKEGFTADQLIGRTIPGYENQEASLLSAVKNDNGEVEEPVDSNLPVITQKAQYDTALSTVTELVAGQGVVVSETVKNAVDSKVEFVTKAAEYGLKELEAKAEEEGLELNDESVGISSDINVVGERANAEIEELKKGRSLFLR